MPQKAPSSQGGRDWDWGRGKLPAPFTAPTSQALCLPGFQRAHGNGAHPEPFPPAEPRARGSSCSSCSCSSCSTSPSPAGCSGAVFGDAPCTPTAAAPSASRAAAARRSLMPSGTIPVITAACWYLCSGIKQPSQHRVGFSRGFCTAQHPEGRRSRAVCPSVRPCLRGWSSRGAEGSPSRPCRS